MLNSVKKYDLTRKSLKCSYWQQLIVSRTLVLLWVNAVCKWCEVGHLNWTDKNYVALFRSTMKACTTFSIKHLTQRPECPVPDIGEFFTWFNCWTSDRLVKTYEALSCLDDCHSERTDCLIECDRKNIACQVQCNVDQVSCAELCPCGELCPNGCDECDFCACLVPEDNDDWQFCQKYHEVEVQINILRRTRVKQFLPRKSILLAVHREMWACRVLLDYLQPKLLSKSKNLPLWWLLSSWMSLWRYSKFLEASSYYTVVVV